MSDDATFTPAAGRPEWTPFYDLAIALLTRERRWRSALLRQTSPQTGDRILDVGCGTGTFAVMLKLAQPGAQVVGLDPDADVLARARTKAKKEKAEVTFRQGFARDAGAQAASFTKVVSSLVFHQVPLEEKRAGLVAIGRALRPGGTLHIADYGLQRTPLMRAAFRQIQKLDGFDNTEPNARGVLPELMREVGFASVEETEVIATVTGSISLYRARRAGA
ncbi:MAG: class I SAM-dependent methyltransferase [Hyphomonadaceae bacterium]|nr:class I SAM-dependent methyltransferase [Hyphomonadaceae bacterium]